MYQKDAILIRKSDNKEFVVTDSVPADGKFRQTDLYSIQSVGEPFQNYRLKTTYEIDRDFEIKDS